MAVRSRPKSKVVVRMVNGTYLDVRMVFKHEGHGKKRRVASSEYGIFHAKTRVGKEGFNKPELAVAFIEENFSKYDKKAKKFK